MFADSIQVVDKFTSNGSVLAELFVGALDFQGGCEGFNCFFVRNSNGNNKGLCGLSVDVEFSKLLSFHVGILDLFSCYVFTLLEFEDVLLPINDAHRLRLGVQGRNISSFKPAVIRNGLLGLGLIVIVAQEDSRSPCPELSSRVRLSFFIFIGREIAHFRDIDQFDLEVGLHN